MPRLPATLLLALVAGLPPVAAAGGLNGGTLRLEPAPPVPAVQAEAGGLRLTGLLGQPVSARSDAAGQALQSGFITPTGVAPGDAIFADGFEESPP